MKKQFLLVAFMFGALSLTYAQNQSSNKSSSGIKGGYNLAAVSYDGEGETGQRHGFHLGFYGESFVSEAIALQVEVLYSQQGYEISNSSGTFNQNLNYINLPLMLKLYPDTHFFLEGGPQIGLAISHKEEFSSGFNIFDTSQEFDPSSFDWGFNVGGGFKTDSGVSIGLRYHIGMGDVYDDGAPKNRVWQFSLGFDF